jgi:hypothetical protein
MKSLLLDHSMVYGSNVAQLSLTSPLTSDADFLHIVVAWFVLPPSIHFVLFLLGHTREPKIADTCPLWQPWTGLPRQVAAPKPFKTSQSPFPASAPPLRPGRFTLLHPLS